MLRYFLWSRGSFPIYNVIYELQKSRAAIYSNFAPHSERNRLRKSSINNMKLFMLLLGCTPPGRNTEQHDIFFGIADNLKDLVPAINKFWPEAKNKIHIDAWREVNFVDDFEVKVYKKKAPGNTFLPQKTKLFFLNLGGYKENEFEEYHYKILAACENKSAAIQRARASAFYKHTGFKGAPSHIDEKYGVDVDDIFDIEDILAPEIKETYGLSIIPSTIPGEDKLNLGYLQLKIL